MEAFQPVSIQQEQIWGGGKSYHQSQHAELSEKPSLCVLLSFQKERRISVYCVVQILLKGSVFLSFSRLLCFTCQLQRLKRKSELLIFLSSQSSGCHDCIAFYIQKQPSGVCEGKDGKGIFIPVLNIPSCWSVEVPAFSSCRQLYLNRHKGENYLFFSNFTTVHRSMSFIVVFHTSVNFTQTF